MVRGRLRTARRRRSANPVGIEDAVAAVTEFRRTRDPGAPRVAPTDRLDDLGLDSVDVAECLILLELAVGAELDLGAVGPVERVEDLTRLERAR